MHWDDFCFSFVSIIVRIYAYFVFGCTKDNPRLCRGNKKALVEKKEINKNPSVEQKWFADHTSTIERDSN